LKIQLRTDRLWNGRSMSTAHLDTDR